MEFRDRQQVLCVTENFRIRGRIRTVPPESEEGDSPTTVSGLKFLTLEEVTLLDLEGRILRKTQKLALNPRYIVYWMEDDQAGIEARVKGLFDREDHEAAVAELRPLVSDDCADGDLHYLAGVAYSGLGLEADAQASYRKALERTVDPRLRAVIRRHLNPV